MKKLDKGFWWFCTGLMLVLSGYIFLKCTTVMSYAENLENIIQPGRLPLFLFGLAGALGSLYCLLSRSLRKLSEKQLRIFAAGAFGVIILGQLLMIITFRTALRGDQMKVFEAAIELMSSGTIANSSYHEYFSRCSNNIPLAMVTYLLVNIFEFLHLPQSIWMDCVRAVGTAFLDGGLLFGYLILKRLKGQRSACMLLSLAAFQPMTYLLSGVYYSSTISLFFGMGAVYFYVRGAKKDKKWWPIPLLTGIFLGFGFKIRATAFICGIAIGICGFLSLRTRRDMKHALKNLGAAAAGFLLVMGLFAGLDKIYVQADYTDTEYTMLHYVMMGAGGNGTYNPTDAAYTQSFEGKEAKIQANKELLLERIEEMGPSGILELIGKKLTITFSDGTDDYYDAFHGVLTDAGNLNYLNGSRRDFFAGYCHVYNTMLWLGILLFLIFGMVKKDRRSFVVMLSALGGIAFQTIWECGEAYSVPYLVLFLMMAAEGFEKVSETAEPLLDQRYVKGGICTASLLLVVGAVLWIGNAFSGVVLVNDDCRVRQTTYEMSIHPADSVVEQTFTASEPFNEIELYVYNVYQEHNQNIYEVTLLTEHGEELAKQQIDGYILPEYGTTYVQFDTVIPRGETVYRLQIVSVEPDERAGIVFPYHSTGIYDLYHGGGLSVDGALLENCDLAFTVYLRTETAGI